MSHTQGNRLGKQLIQRDRSGVRWIHGIGNFSEFGKFGARMVHFFIHIIFNLHCQNDTENDDNYS